MSDSTEELMKKLDALAEDEKLHLLSKDEKYKLKLIIKVFDFLYSLGAIGRFMSKTIIVVGIIIGAYSAVTGKLTELIRAIAGSAPS